MNRPARTLWGLVAVGAATAVGITTHEPGFVVITFLGSLVLPRVLGLTGRRGWRGPAAWAGRCAGWDAGRSRLDDRLASWHRQAHGETGTPPPGGVAQV
jgi:hypothetical protein